MGNWIPAQASKPLVQADLESIEWKLKNESWPSETLQFYCTHKHLVSFGKLGGARPDSGWSLARCSVISACPMGLFYTISAAQLAPDASVWLKWPLDVTVWRAEALPDGLKGVWATLSSHQGCSQQEGQMWSHWWCGRGCMDHISLAVILKARKQSQKLLCCLAQAWCYWVGCYFQSFWFIGPLFYSVS